jgi:acetyl/propionyl-CoA carboxylase alpha subunit
MAAAFMWWFSPVSAQFMGEHLQQERLGCVQEEMVAGKHPQREGTARLITPCLEIATAHPVILQAAKGGDGAGERRFD